MSKRGSTFARIFIGLAILFVVSLGLCGMNGMMESLPSGLRNNEALVTVVLIIEIGGMLVSVVGFFVTAIVWLIVRASGRTTEDPPTSVTPRQDDKRD